MSPVIPRRGLTLSVLVLAAVFASVWRLDLIAAFAEGQDSLGELFGFLQRFAAPDTSPAFLSKVGQGAIDQQIVVGGSAVGMIVDVGGVIGDYEDFA